MEKLIITFLISFVTCPLYFSDYHTHASCGKNDSDSFLIELIEKKKPIIHEYINPLYKRYRIDWSASYDLEGNRLHSAEIFQIIVFPKHGKVFGVGNISEAKQYGLDSIYKKEQWRIHQYINELDVSKLIRDQSPCISNEFRSEGVIGMFFMYDILPHTD